MYTHIHTHKYVYVHICMYQTYADFYMHMYVPIHATSLNPLHHLPPLSEAPHKSPRPEPRLPRSPGQRLSPSLGGVALGPLPLRNENLPALYLCMYDDIYIYMCMCVYELLDPYICLMYVLDHPEGLPWRSQLSVLHLKGQRTW